MDKFRVAFGKKFDDTSLMSLHGCVMHDVTSGDLLAIVNLMNTYADEKSALVISKESV